MHFANCFWCKQKKFVVKKRFLRVLHLQDKGGKDDKKKKKKGEPDVELQHSPPEYRELASFHVPLEDFLEGETRFETVFIEGGAQRPPSPPPTEEERAQVRQLSKCTYKYDVHVLVRVRVQYL